MAALKIGVLISGRGSNLQALIDACAEPEFPAEIALVISNAPEAAGLERAERASIATTVIEHRDFTDRDAFDRALDAALMEAGVELVCLAGFMRLLGAPFVERRRDRVINIHPSLLPAFKGIDAHEQAIASGVRFSGCTVHFVRAEVDSGPIIVQAAVPVRTDDNPETLAERVLAAEHRIYPAALRYIAEGRVRVEGERVRIDGAATPDGVSINPAQ